MLPTPWLGVLLALAAYRLTRLVGWDDVPPVQQLRDRLTGAEFVKAQTPEMAGGVTGYWRYDRPKLAAFLHCAWCQGFWTGAAVYGMWLAAGSPERVGRESWCFYLAVPFALSAVVGLVAKNLDE